MSKRKYEVWVCPYSLWLSSYVHGRSRRKQGAASCQLLISGSSSNHDSELLDLGRRVVEKALPHKRRNSRLEEPCATSSVIRVNQAPKTSNPPAWLESFQSKLQPAIAAWKGTAERRKFNYTAHNLKDAPLHDVAQNCCVESRGSAGDGIGTGLLWGKEHHLRCKGLAFRKVIVRLLHFCQFEGQ